MLAEFNKKCVKYFYSASTSRQTLKMFNCIMCSLSFRYLENISLKIYGWQLLENDSKFCCLVIYFALRQYIFSIWVKVKSQDLKYWHNILFLISIRLCLVNILTLEPLDKRNVNINIINVSKLKIYTHLSTFVKFKFMNLNTVSIIMQ